MSPRNASAYVLEDRRNRSRDRRAVCGPGAAGYLLRMPSSIGRLTALDHDRMQRLVRRACASGPSQQRWRDELVLLVRAHLAAERALLTHDLISKAGDDAVHALAELPRLNADLEQAVEEMAVLAIDSDKLGSACDNIARALAVHAEVLGTQVLRPLEQSVARKEVRRLGGAYSEGRDRALRAEGANEPTPRRLDLSRAELYELAKKAGIEGRSAMSRRDLIAELQRRQQAG